MMAAAISQSMPPPQAPAAMGPPPPTQAMVAPQFSHNASSYPEGPQSALMNGSAVTEPPTGHTQQFPNSLHNGLSAQVPPNVSVNTVAPL